MRPSVSKWSVAGIISLLCAGGFAQDSVDSPVLVASQELQALLSAAEAAVQAAPDDSDALASLASLRRQLGDSNSSLKLYQRAAAAALQAGRIRFTRELSELLVESNDATGLRLVFEPLLSTDPEIDSSAYYLALVDFADGLASLGDESAWSVFEEAVRMGGAANQEAINRYAEQLLANGRYAQCLELVNRLSDAERVRRVLPVYLRYECTKALGLDPTEAAAEVERLGLRRMPGFGVVQQAPLEAPVDTE